MSLIIYEDFKQINDATKVLFSIIEFLFKKNSQIDFSEATLQLIKIIKSSSSKCENLKFCKPNNSYKHHKIMYFIRQIHPGLGCNELRLHSSKLYLYSIQEIFSENSSKDFFKPLEKIKVFYINNVFFC